MLTFPNFTPHFSREQWALPALPEYQPVHPADRHFLSWMDVCKPQTFSEVNATVNQLAHKTAETRRNLWFDTGDAMRRGPQGWYYFVDRVKDALRCRGENISSFEAESGVRSHAAVAECAVIGVRADQAAGEDEIMACVVWKEGVSFSFEDLIEWCDTRMPAFMVPRYIEVVLQLPWTATEKIQKKVLRERGVNAETWDRAIKNKVGAAEASAATEAK